MPRVLLLLPICLCLAPRNAPESASVLEDAPTLTLTANEKPSPKEFARLVKDDIVGALAASLRRYREEVKDYTCKMYKQERIGGRVRKQEVIACAFREKPFSVLMEWESGDSRAAASLFVAGENSDEILVRPAGKIEIMGLKAVGKHWVQRATNHPQVVEASRYTVHEFGIARGMERTYSAWRAAKEAGVLKVEYLGEKAVPELDGRICYVIHRTVDPPEEDGMTDLTLFLDKENWLQTGSILKKNEDLIGSYFFRDLKLNADLGKEQFKPDVLRK